MLGSYALARYRAASFAAASKEKLAMAAMGKVKPEHNKPDGRFDNSARKPSKIKGSKRLKPICLSSPKSSSHR
jgi:hypothetical protein